MVSHHFQKISVSTLPQWWKQLCSFKPCGLIAFAIPPLGIQIKNMYLICLLVAKGDGCVNSLWMRYFSLFLLLIHAIFICLQLLANKEHIRKKLLLVGTTCSVGQSCFWLYMTNLFLKWMVDSNQQICWWVPRMGLLIWKWSDPCSLQRSVSKIKNKH